MLNLTKTTLVLMDYPQKKAQIQFSSPSTKREIISMKFQFIFASFRILLLPNELFTQNSFTKLKMSWTARLSLSHLNPFLPHHTLIIRLSHDVFKFYKIFCHHNLKFQFVMNAYIDNLNVLTRGDSEEKED